MTDSSELVQTSNPNVRYLIAGGAPVRLTRGEDSLWRDEQGTVFSLTEPTHYQDTVTRAGVGVFALSKEHVLSDFSRGHDHAYSSPAYQAFNERCDADKYLESCLLLAPGYDRSITPELFEFLSRMFGARWWERAETND